LEKKDWLNKNSNCWVSAQLKFFFVPVIKMFYCCRDDWFQWCNIPENACNTCPVWNDNNEVGRSVQHESQGRGKLRPSKWKYW